MKRFFKKVIPYLKGIGAGLLAVKPERVLGAIASSDEVIKPIRQYGFAIIVNVHDRMIGRPILLKSSYEENVTQTFLKYLQPDTHFLDIGANIGYYSLLAASQCPQGKVYSFEPDASNFRLLQTSIYYNKFDAQIQAYQLAVSNKNDSILLLDVGETVNSGAKVTAQDQESLSLFRHSRSHLQTIDAVQLDSFLANARIDLVKMDIEGHEPFAIEGMTDLIRQNRPIILIEFAPISLAQIGKISAEAFLQRLIDLGYQISIIDQDGNLIHCQHNIGAVMQYFHHRGSNHIDLLLIQDGEPGVSTGRGSS